MAITKERVLYEALSLPPIERAQLIEEVLSSFEFPTRHEFDENWAVEAEDRIEAYERGELKTSSAEDVFKRINSV